MMTEEKCIKYDDIYKSVLDVENSDNYILFKLASCFLNGYDISKLREMLSSDDKCHVSDALFILGEIGDMTLDFIEDIEAISKYDDADLSDDARRLLASMLRFRP